MPPDTPHPANDDQAAWSSLWSRTLRGSIDLDSDDPIAEVLRTHWAEARPWLARCRHVVDVGSGPAVLARHLRGRGGTPAIDGLVWCCVDGAQLPAAAAEGAWLRCLGETDFATSVPPDGPRDALVSNFGLEYVSRPAWAAACARWLLPGGELHAVMHARGSVIDLTSARTLEDLVFAMDGQRLFDRVEELLRVVRTLPADPAARRLHGAAERAAYNAVADELKARMADRARRSAVWIDLLTASTEALRQALEGAVDAALARVADLRLAYGAERIRLQAMRASAIGEAERAQMSEDLRAAGFEAPVWHPIDSALGRVAWHLQARRRGDTPAS